VTSVAPALELLGIEKRFGETRALAGANMRVGVGSLHMLLGENGAGKTTALNVAAGLVPSDAGTILLRGIPVRWRGPSEARQAGVRAVHQHFSLVPEMTVAENVALAWQEAWTAFAPRACADAVLQVADAVGLVIDPNAVVGDLPVVAQQRVEIIKALAPGASLLILDEPTAVLSPTEAADLFAWLRKYVARGHTAVVITHRIREALQFGDALTVLRAGRTTFAASHGEVSEAVVLEAILGDRPVPVSRDQCVHPDALDDRRIVARIASASVVDSHGVPRLVDATLEIRAGEIVGVAGVEGSGVAELLRLLAARLAQQHGTVELPEDIGFVPEDRLRDALIGDFSIAENFALRQLGFRRGVMDWRAVEQSTATAIAAFDVRGTGTRQSARSLSGGNQQRLVLAREISGSPPLIVAENPARGLDVRATAAVFDRLCEARNAGTAVVVHSSDIDDLVAVADRMVVCFGGRLRETPVTFDAVGAAMLGGP
jgi:simple sugar transport system ATP-binding protein